MKQAYKGKCPGSIFLSLEKNDDTATFIVQDGGVGLPPTISLDKPTGFGLTLVKNLTDQLNGKIKA